MWLRLDCGAIFCTFTPAAGLKCAALWRGSFPPINPPQSQSSVMQKCFYYAAMQHTPHSCEILNFDINQKQHLEKATKGTCALHFKHNLLFFLRVPYYWPPSIRISCGDDLFTKDPWQIFPTRHFSEYFVFMKVSMSKMSNSTTHMMVETNRWRWKGRKMPPSHELC